MAIPKFIKHQPEGPNSYDFIALQNILEPILEDYTDRAFSDHLLLESEAIGTSTTLVNHTLDRTVRGWVIVDTNADARIWRDDTDTNDTTKYLALKASAAVTISLIVF